MKNKFTIIITICLLLSISMAFGIEKPSQRNDPFMESSSPLLSFMSEAKPLNMFDISPSPLSIMGSSCSNEYSTTGEYCSGNVRVYFQCLKTSSGLEYQQRSENCADYSGRCVMNQGKAECVDGWGQTEYGNKILFMSIGLFIIGLVIVGIGFFGYIPLWLSLISIVFFYYGIKLMIKFIAGGV